MNEPSCLSIIDQDFNVLGPLLPPPLTSGTWTERFRRKSWKTGSETCTVLNAKDPYRSSIASLDLAHALAALVATHSPFLFPFDLSPPFLCPSRSPSPSNGVSDKWQLGRVKFPHEFDYSEYSSLFPSHPLVPSSVPADISSRYDFTTAVIRTRLGGVCRYVSSLISRDDRAYDDVHARTCPTGVKSEERR